MNYYPVSEDEKKEIVPISISKSNFDEFVTVFPNQLNLEEGISYELYFQVFDNDAINNYKSTKSNVFTYRKLTKEELEQEQLKEQSETIEDLNNSFEKLKNKTKNLRSFLKLKRKSQNSILMIKRN